MFHVNRAAILMLFLSRVNVFYCLYEKNKANRRQLHDGCSLLVFLGLLEAGFLGFLAETTRITQGWFLKIT